MNSLFKKLAFVGLVTTALQSQWFTIQAMNSDILEDFGQTTQSSYFSKKHFHQAAAIAIAPASYVTSILEAKGASTRTLNTAHIVIELLRLINDGLIISNEINETHSGSPVFLTSSTCTTLFALAGYIDGLRNDTFNGTPVNEGTSTLKMAGRGTVKILMPIVESFFAFLLTDDEPNEEDKDKYVICSLLKNTAQHISQASDSSAEQKTKLIISLLAIIIDSAEFANYVLNHFAMEKLEGEVANSQQILDQHNLHFGQLLTHLNFQLEQQAQANNTKSSEQILRDIQQRPNDYAKLGFANPENFPQIVELLKKEKMLRNQ